MKPFGNRPSLYCRHEQWHPGRCAPVFHPPEPAVTATLDGDRHVVAVVGAGQAGLAMSHCLSRRGVDHVVLEKHRIGYEWRERRWDSFCLVTPNWQCQLPGFGYRGSEPDGFMGRDEITRYLEEYAAS